MESRTFNVDQTAPNRGFYSLLGAEYANFKEVIHGNGSEIGCVSKLFHNLKLYPDQAKKNETEKWRNSDWPQSTSG